MLTLFDFHSSRNVWKVRQLLQQPNRPNRIVPIGMPKSWVIVSIGSFWKINLA
jgi:hypothetical protein